jgi:hypothetical protein
LATRVDFLGDARSKVKANNTKTLLLVVAFTNWDNLRRGRRRDQMLPFYMFATSNLSCCRRDAGRRRK